MALAIAPFPESSLSPLQAAMSQSQGDLMKSAQLQAQNNQFAQEIMVRAQEKGREEASNAINNAFTLLAQNKINAAKNELQRETNATNLQINMLELAMRQKEAEALQAYRGAQLDISQQNADANTYRAENPVGSSKTSPESIVSEAFKSQGLPSPVQSEVPTEAAIPADAAIRATGRTLDASLPGSSTESGVMSVVSDTLSELSDTEPSLNPPSASTALVGELPSSQPQAQAAPSSPATTDNNLIEQGFTRLAPLLTGKTQGDSTVTGAINDIAASAPPDQIVAVHTALSKRAAETLAANAKADETAKTTSAVQKQALDDQQKLAQDKTTLELKYQSYTPEQQAIVRDVYTSAVNSDKGFSMTEVANSMDKAIADATLKTTEKRGIIKDQLKLIQDKFETDKKLLDFPDDPTDPETKRLMTQYAYELAAKKAELDALNPAKTTTAATYPAGYDISSLKNIATTAASLSTASKQPAYKTYIDKAMGK